MKPGASRVSRHPDKKQTINEERKTDVDVNHALNSNAE
jgi:hypothetical protein